MNLERVAAEAFLDELKKIAAANDGEKVASVAVGSLTLEDIEGFMKEAGFFNMMGSIGRGLGAAGMGALRGGASLAGGATRGVVGAARNAVGGGINSLRNAAGSVAGAVKAAPANLGQRMNSFGQGVQQRLTNFGQNMANAGANRGQAIQARLSGANGQSAMRDIQSWQSRSATPAAPTHEETSQALANIAGHRNDGGAQSVPMMTAGQQVQASNPFAGMGDTLVQGVRGLLNPPNIVKPSAPTYGAQPAVA